MSVQLMAFIRTNKRLKLKRLSLLGGLVNGMFVSCEYCEKSIHRSSLTRHVKTQHTERESKVQCQHCSGVYKSMDSLGKHMRDVHGIYQSKQ